MIVSHRHRFIFVKTRKTAGTSVEIALSRYCGPSDVITPTMPEDERIRREWGGIGPQNFEPPALPVKSFAHFGCRAIKSAVGDQVWDGYFKFAVERNPWDAVVSYYHYLYRDRDPIDFSEFVMSARPERLAKNQHKIRMHGRVCMDMVCRFESLGADLIEAWNRIGLPDKPELPRAKAGLRPAGSTATYRDYYGSREKDRVAHLFRKTIRDFGYEF